VEKSLRTLDLRKDLKHLYAPPPGKVQLVDVSEFQFATLEGRIEPGERPGSSPAFQSAFEALYGIAFTLKFASKQRQEDPVDYQVMTMEGLWWIEEGEFDFSQPDNWFWRLLILQPEHITQEMFERARAQLRKKRDNPDVERLRLERFREGLCVQCLHLGPYATEPETIAKMHAFAREQGYQLRGLHHEIYLGDPRRAAPEKLKTILRHPVERVVG
jgi:hypothetical protein